MKKILTLFLTLAMLLSLAACGAKKDEDKTPAEDNKQEETTTPETPAEKPEEKPEEKPAEPEVPAAPAQVDLQAFFESLVTKYGENFPANAELSSMPEMLNGFFPGLSAIETKQLMIYQPMMGAVVCEIALVEVANEADVAAVKDILKARIDAQVDGGAWYPASIEGWEKNSRIVDNGNYVMMIAYEMCDEVVEAFNGLFA